MKHFYVYLHLTPQGDPFWVGKGSDDGKHSRSHHIKRKNEIHTKIVALHGRRNIEVLKFYRDSEAAAFEDEICWIRVLRTAGYAIANLTDGGPGPLNPVPELRAKQSTSHIGKQSHLGIPHSPETRKKQSIAKIGNKNGCGWVPTPEQLRKMSAARQGKPWSPARRVAYLRSSTKSI